MQGQALAGISLNHTHYLHKSNPISRINNRKQKLIPNSGMV